MSPIVGRPTVLAMTVNWDIVQSGPKRAERTVLLLPGGMCSARSYAEVTAEPLLADTRLIAATMPGQAGAPPIEGYSPVTYARHTAELVKEVSPDVVVGFSMGACIAAEMVTSGLLTVPTVLLGVSLSTKDEPAFFRGLIRLTAVAGNVPMRVLAAGAASMVKRIAAPPDRQAELVADFRKNDPRDLRCGLRAYLQWLRDGEGRAERLCDAAVPIWVVHAEKGDGGLTAHERVVLDACPHVRLVTLPGKVFFLPNEAPTRVAELIVEALGSEYLSPVDRSGRLRQRHSW
jgi:pimeloyl-ACP methyl ester carboxylesterase